MAISRLYSAATCIFLLIIQVLADAQISFYNDPHCTEVSELFFITVPKSGTCSNTVREFTYFQILSADAGCGVTAYDKANSFCGTDAKYLVTPNICYPRNNTDQFTLDCNGVTSASSSSSQSSSSSTPTQSPTTSSNTPTQSSTSSSSKDPSPNPGITIGIPVVFGTLGLILAAVTLYYAIKSYQRGGRARNLVRHASFRRSRAISYV